MPEVNGSFELAWARATRRLAAAAGAAVALAALLNDVALEIAVLRGGATTVGLLLVVRYGLRVLLRLALREALRPQASAEGPLTDSEQPMGHSEDERR